MEEGKKVRKGEREKTTNSSFYQEFTPTIANPLL
jgi:hypothetical protein